LYYIDLNIVVLKMGNAESTPKVDETNWEGKFFTTSDGIKLSSQVVKRLTHDREEEERQKALEEQKAKLFREQEALKTQHAREQMDMKLQQLERTHVEQTTELEQQRERNNKIMTDYDSMISTRELQIHQLISDLERERTKYADAIRERDEKLSDICNIWNEKLTEKEKEYTQLEDRLKGRESELNEVTENLTVQIQDERDKFSAVTSDLSNQIATEQAKLNQVTEELTKQIKEEQDKLDNVSKTVYDEFESAANRVEKKFEPSGFQSVCSSAQSSLLDCYQNNPGKPLACSVQLDEFKDCVAKSKSKLWEKQEGMNE